MLSIAKINNAEYYLDINSDDYYLDSYNQHSFWCGLGSIYLGLALSQVKEEPYKQLMQGFDQHDTPLVQNAGKPKRRIGWDLTFSAPKSVSLIWTAASDEVKEQILFAHKTAVTKAIDVLEQKAAITRRGKRSKQYEKVSGLVVASFAHFSSRELEPQLHNHCVVFNAAPRRDDSWGSIESYKFYKYKKAVGACYRSELAAQLKMLGFEIEADNDFFHIKGVSKALCEQYSTRSDQINAYNKKYGHSYKAAEKTRVAKKAESETTFSDWKDKLSREGFTEEVIDSIKVSERKPEYFSTLSAHSIVYQLTDKQSVFSESELLNQIAIEASHQGLNTKAILDTHDQALADPLLIKVSRENSIQNIYTTFDAIEADRLMLKNAKRLQKRVCRTFKASDIEKATQKAQQELGIAFNHEQLAAIQHMMTTGNLCITQGSAGAGKTTSLLALKNAYEERNFIIKGASVAKKAADNLQIETGIQSCTIASIISQIKERRHPLKGVDALVIDEAGLLPSNDLLRLFEEAWFSDCKIILTGEDKQLDAINQGGALRYLSKPENIGAYRIEEVKRQREEWARQVVMNLRDGKSSKALKILEAQGCLHWQSGRTESIKALVDDWYAYQTDNPDKKSLVIAKSWKEVKQLSEMIRSILISEGKVSTEDVPLKCSVAGGSHDYKYSVGDRVKFCRNEYQKLQVTNGMTGTIKQIRPTKGDALLLVETDDGRALSFLASEYADEKGTFLCHAYALTIFSAQGVTVDGNTYTLFSNEMDRANAYVALSRHKDKSHMYLDASKLYVDEFSLKEHLEMDSSKDIQKLRHEAISKRLKEDSYSKLAIEWVNQKDAVDFGVSIDI